VPALFEALSGMQMSELFAKVKQLKGSDPEPDGSPKAGTDGKAKAAGSGSK
jgi:hypothetical protein